MKRIAAVTFVCMLAVAAQADQNQAFQDAKTFAGSKNQGTFSGISSGAVSDKIPGYGTNPTEAQFFQGGQGALSGPGVTKMQNCASYAPGQNKIANQECEAVNFLARNPDVRPRFNIGNNDQMILGAKNARDNAATVFQSFGINGGTGNSAQCTTRTETTPAQYTTETCTSLRAIEGQQCTMGRKIDIDADSNFQCDKTLTAFTSANRQPTVSTSSCTYGRQVNIDEDSRFQCDQTVGAYESLNCRHRLVVTAVPNTVYCGNKGVSVATIQFGGFYGSHKFTVTCGVLDATGKPTFDINYTALASSFNTYNSTDCDVSLHNLPSGVIRDMYPIPGTDYEGLRYPNPTSSHAYYGGTQTITTCQRYTGGSTAWLHPVIEIQCDEYGECNFYAIIGIQGSAWGASLLAYSRARWAAGSAKVKLPQSSINKLTYTWDNDCAALEARAK